MKVRRVPAPPTARRATEKPVQSFLGLNTTYPYTQLKDSESPHFYNVRLYARNATDRRVAVGTRKGPGAYSVPLGETVDQQQTAFNRTNLITNPSFETNTTSWSGTRCTLATSSSFAQSGSQSLAATITSVAGNPAAVYSSSGLTVGVTYTISAYFKANAGDTIFIYADPLTAAYTEVTATGNWQRLSVSGVASATSGDIEFGADDSTVAVNDIFYVDAVLLEASASVGDYFDGSTTDTATIDYAWTGTAHASTSTTSVAQTINTGTWLAKKITAGASGRLTKADLRLKTGTSPTQHIIVAFYSDSSGSPGTLQATSSILSSSVTSSYTYISARFIEAPVVASGTAYWIVAYMQMGGSGSYNWSSTTAASTAKTSSNQGGTWSSTSYDLNAKTYVSTNSPQLGGFRYTPSNATAKTILAHGTNIYTVSEVDGTTTSIKSGLSSSAIEYNFAQSNDILYYVNGQDAPRQWDGTTEQAVTNAPVTSKYITFHKNRMWLVDITNPTKVWFSDLGTYTSWTSTNFIFAPAPKSGDPITGISVFQDNLVVFTRKTKYVLFGDDPGNFVLRQSSGKKGTINQAVIAADPNYIYFLADDGIYRYNGSSDELMSDPVQTEIDNIADKSKCAAVVHNNYYRLYYPKTGSTTNDSCLIWDSLNRFWLRDSNTFIDRPFVGETNTLYEGSSRVGAIYRADQAYSDLGKPIDFVYWTKYFGDGLHKIFLRRVIPSIRLQTQPYSLNMYIDIDQRGNIPLQYQIAAQASGSEWGDGHTWTTGTTTTWGSATVSTPAVAQGSEGYWHQIRYEQEGVDTPVEILSYILQFRSRRLE